ncbi:Hypothetical protein GLP15_818 [Giardia lamblia P15]|uniref:Uncharacterized protein n=1 Tax=Giardia intestinalis (strain P15) TaxID=658858 RepID=E1EXT6_GIAIA|nr:Hypothetical protein GLP15_818 [Giardia lamblia P15]
MTRYWTGTTKILLLVGIPCIVTTYTIAVIPRDINLIVRALTDNNGFSSWLLYYSDVRAWLGTVLVLAILILYSLVSHILYCCKCSKSQNVIIYCYLASIGTGYCASVDLFFCLFTTFGSSKIISYSLVLLGDLSRYATLSVGIAWFFTVTVGPLLLNTGSICLKTLTPIIGSLISFGLPLFIVLINGAGLYSTYTTSQYLIAGFILAFLGLVCYLLGYFVEFQKKKILSKYDAFSGSSISFGRTPTSSTTVLSTAHDSSMYRGYSNDAYSYA